jgi:hypothetical protein
MAMNELFETEILPKYRLRFEMLINESSEQIICDYLREFHQTRAQQAEMILSKYKLLSTEYQNQYKMFKEKHEQVCRDEQAKREKIIRNFEDHYQLIKKQMTEDQNKFINKDGKLEITAENEMLEEKYEEMLKEIEEKKELMQKQLEDKEGSAEEMKKTMGEQIESQLKDMEKQIELYREQGELKKKEDQQLAAVLGEYRAKFN